MNWDNLLKIELSKTKNSTNMGKSLTECRTYEILNKPDPATEYQIQSQDIGMVRCQWCKYLDHWGNCRKNVSVPPILKLWRRCEVYSFSGSYRDIKENTGIKAANTALPSMCRKYDEKWITERLMTHPQADWQNILKEYDRIFVKAMAGEAVEHKKENVGSFAANSWLREYQEGL